MELSPNILQLGRQIKHNTGNKWRGSSREIADAESVRCRKQRSTFENNETLWDYSSGCARSRSSALSALRFQIKVQMQKPEYALSNACKSF
jgi:hypothetical protein